MDTKKSSITKQISKLNFEKLTIMDIIMKHTNDRECSNDDIKDIITEFKTNSIPISSDNIKKYMNSSLKTEELQHVKKYNLTLDELILIDEEAIQNKIKGGIAGYFEIYEML